MTLVQLAQKLTSESRVGRVAQWLVELLQDLAVPGLIPSISEFFSEEKLSMMLRLIDSVG